MKSKLVKDYSIWPDQFVVFSQNAGASKRQASTLRWFCRLLERIFFEKIRWVKFSLTTWGKWWNLTIYIIFFKWVENHQLEYYDLASHATWRWFTFKLRGCFVFSPPWPFFQVMVYMGGLGPGALEFYGCAQVISPLWKRNARIPKHQAPQTTWWYHQVTQVATIEVVSDF